MQPPKGIQQTRTRLNLSVLMQSEERFTLKDASSGKPLIDLSTSLYAPGHGYIVIRLFSGYDVLYRVWLSDEILNSEVTLDKLIKLVISKLAMETHLALRLIAFDTKIDVEMDPDEENVIVLWLDNTALGDFEVTGETIEYVKVSTDLQGSMIKIQIADIFRRVINDVEKGEER